MQAVVMPDHPSAGTGRQQLYDIFLDGLFNGLVALIAGPNIEGKPAPVHLIQLVVGLVDLADRKRRTERKKRIAKEICHGLSLTLISGNADGGIADELNYYMECYVRSLHELIVSDPNARDYLTGEKPSCAVQIDEHLPDNAASCGIHNGRPVCKSSTDGGDKFYVCSQEKCNFFVWANDRGSGRAADCANESEFDVEVAQHIWKLLSTLQHEKTSFCDFLEAGFAGSDESDSQGSILTRPRTYKETYRGVLDGVLCCKERLFLSQTADEFVAEASILPLTEPARPNSWGSLIESWLVLLCLVMGADIDGGITAWLPLLCTIMMEENSSVSSLAKTAVFRLCGRNSDLYFAVRDRHAFGIHMKKVISLSWPLLQQASLLKERARLYSVDWKETHTFSWSESGGFEFVGLQLLIAEDTLSPSSHDAIRKQLNEILSSAKKRPLNWKRFCRLKSIQRSTVDTSPASPVCRLPPARVLFFLACILPSDCQARVMKLLDIGIPHLDEMKAIDTDTRGLKPAVLDFVEPTSASLTKAIDAVSISHEVIRDFSAHFVLRGGRNELRRSAGNLMSKLCIFIPVSKALFGALCLELWLMLEKWVDQEPNSSPLLPTLLKKYHGKEGRRKKWLNTSNQYGLNNCLGSNTIERTMNVCFSRHE